MKQISTEKFIEKLGMDVYPITIVKFLLNRKKIMNYFQKAEDKNFQIRGNHYQIDNSECETCKSKKDDNISCRQHTSIFRVLSGENVGFDLNTKVYFYKNEIFKKVDDTKLVIVYCPHPKLIKIIGEELTDESVRKISPITIDDKKLKMKEFKNICNFSSNDLMDSYMKCWFNNNFSIVTLPEDRNGSKWCLVPNIKIKNK